MLEKVSIDVAVLMVNNVVDHQVYALQEVVFQSHINRRLSFLVQVKQGKLFAEIFIVFAIQELFGRSLVEGKISHHTFQSHF